MDGLAGLSRRAPDRAARLPQLPFQTGSKPGIIGNAGHAAAADINHDLEVGDCCCHLFCAGSEHKKMEDNLIGFLLRSEFQYVVRFDLVRRSNLPKTRY